MRICCLLLGASLLACSDPPARPAPYGCLTKRRDENWECVYYSVPAGPNRICLWTPAVATTEEVVDRCPAEMREDGCYQANGVGWCRYTAH